VPVNKHESVASSNLFPTTTASGSGPSSFDEYDMASVADKYLRPDNVAVTTPGESDRVARVWIAARLYLNSPPEAPQNWGQIYPNLNDYNSGSMEVSSTF